MSGAVCVRAAGLELDCDVRHSMHSGALRCHLAAVMELNVVLHRCGQLEREVFELRRKVFERTIFTEYHFGDVLFE